MKSDIKHFHSHKSIILKAIEKAILNGFDFGVGVKDINQLSISSFNPETCRMVITLKQNQKVKLIYDNYKLIFFAVSFAKAIFGDEWEEHLKELASTPNILDYLNEHL